LRYEHMSYSREHIPPRFGEVEIGIACIGNEMVDVYWKWFTLTQPHTHRHTCTQSSSCDDDVAFKQSLREWFVCSSTARLP
jgi:hypothetical protein